MQASSFDRALRRPCAILLSAAVALWGAACGSSGHRDAGVDDAGPHDAATLDAATADAATPDAATPDAGTPPDAGSVFDCSTNPMTFPESWRDCETAGDCATAIDARGWAYYVFGVALTARGELASAALVCAATNPGEGVMGLPRFYADDGSGGLCSSVACDKNRCATHALTAGASCDRHVDCEGDALCLSDPCISPPCPGNGNNPVCHVCGGPGPCHCGFFVAFQSCASDADCDGRMFGCDGWPGPCPSRCVHQTCAPNTYDLDPPYCQ